MTTNPVINMTHPRAKIWKEQATDEDFMKYLDSLASIYAGRKRQEEFEKNGKYKKLNEVILFKDYKEWLKSNGQIKTY